MPDLINQDQVGGEWKDRNIDILEIHSPTHNKTFGSYTVGNPHPGFGKDPNILNELGHTVYPKLIDSKIEGKRVVVNSPMEEAQHTGEKVEEQKPANIDPWTK